MKFISSLFKKTVHPKSDPDVTRRNILAGSEIVKSQKDAIRRINLNNQVIASVYNQQILPLTEKFIGETVIASAVGTTGFALFLTDGSCITAFLANGTITWEILAQELVKEIEDLINSSETGNDIYPLSEEEIIRMRGDLSNTHSKEIASISLGTLHGNQRVKFYFPDHGELFIGVGPSWPDNYALWVRWLPPMKLIWRGEVIGYLLEFDNDMGLIEGVWESNETQLAKDFEKLATNFDKMAVLRDHRLGTLIELQEGGNDNLYGVVIMLHNRQLLIHSVISQAAIDWVKQYVH